MNKPPLTLCELREYASRLPSELPGADHCRVPVMPRISSYRYWEQCDLSAEIMTVDFHRRRVHVDGAPAWGWFYHDILVRVDV